jgi:sodium pump decarboxylase gamma subunit
MTDAIVFGIMLTGIGMGIVFMTLFILQLVIMLLGAVDRRIARRTGSAAAAPAPVEEVPADLLAAIAAAVTVAFHEPTRIHHIHLSQGENQAAWSRIGRLDIMRSHPTGSAKH